MCNKKCTRQFVDHGEQKQKRRYCDYVMMSFTFLICEGIGWDQAVSHQQKSGLKTDHHAQQN